MPSDPRDYKIEVTGVTPADNSASAPAGRPYLSVQFACCRALTRTSYCTCRWVAPLHV